jgi:hypothetical protein
MELVLQGNKRNKKIEVGVRAITERLFVVMRDHIGQDNSIERAKLFKKVFQVSDEDISVLHREALFSFLKRAMHTCRQRTKCFITSYKLNGEYLYFVVKDENDADVYRQNAERTAKQLRAMTRRAFKAAKENWHKLEWVY